MPGPLPPSPCRPAAGGSPAAAHAGAETAAPPSPRLRRCTIVMTCLPALRAVCNALCSWRCRCSPRASGEPEWLQRCGSAWNHRPEPSLWLQALAIGCGPAQPSYIVQLPYVALLVFYSHPPSVRYHRLGNPLDPATPASSCGTAQPTFVVQEHYVALLSFYSHPPSVRYHRLGLPLEPATPASSCGRAQHTFFVMVPYVALLSLYRHPHPVRYHRLGTPPHPATPGGGSLCWWRAWPPAVASRRPMLPLGLSTATLLLSGTTGERPCPIRQHRGADTHRHVRSMYWVGRPRNLSLPLGLHRGGGPPASGPAP